MKKFMALSLDGINFEDDEQRKKAAESILAQMMTFVERIKLRKKAKTRNNVRFKTLMYRVSQNNVARCETEQEAQ